MEGITLEKLKVVIEAYTKPYKDEMDKIRQKTAAVTGQVERETSKMRNSYKKVAAVTAGVLSVAGIVSFGKSCIELGSDLQEVQNVVDVTFGEMNRQVNAFAKNAIEKYGLSELAAKEYMGTYGSMAKSFGFTTDEVYELSASITGLTGDLASFRNLTTDEAYTKLKSIFTGETESLKEIGVVMTQTALDQYALNEGLGKTTANMTEQEKVMLRYRFVMSSLSDAQGDFARTSHSWANQVRVLQLRFESLKATIGQGLINALTPVIQVINTIIAKLQTLAAYFKSFTAALFGDAGGGGADSMASAVGSSGAVADNMNTAAGAAKKLKEYTLGIDELNVLRSEDASGGSGGSGAGKLDFGNMSGELFGDVTVNPEIEEATERIRMAVERLREAARPSAEALERLWDEGLAKLGNFSWTALEDFWNYFLVPLGGWALGEGFPRFVDITNDFLMKINWTDINDALREFWTALEPFAENVGEGLLDFYEGLAGVGAEFINAIVPGGIHALADVLSSVDADNARDFGYALGVISTALLGLGVAGVVAPKVEALGKALKNLPGFIVASGGPGTAAFDIIGMQIVDVISKFIEENLGQSVVDAIGHGLLIAVGVAYGGALAGPVGALAGGIVVTLADVLMNIDWSGDVWEKVCKKLFNFDTANALAEQAKEFFKTAFYTDNFLEFGSNIVAGIATGITAGIAYLIEPITDLLGFVVEEICDLFGIHSPASSMEPYGQYILEGIILGFRNTFGGWTDSLNEWYSRYIEPWFTLKKWSELYDSIKVSMKKKWDETVEQWKSDTGSWWIFNVEPWFTKQKWLELYSNIKGSMKERWGETAGQWKTDMNLWWTTDVSPWFTIEKWLGVYDNIRSSLKEIWDSACSTWKLDIGNWWSEDVSTWFTMDKWNGMMSEVPGAFSKIFRDAVNAAVHQLNKLIDWVNDKLYFEYDGLEILGQEVIPSFSTRLFTIPHIPELASGGVVNSGQLFIASEKGPELVGRYGNRSGVMNNDQIVSAVSSGVAEAVAKVMAAYEDSQSSDRPIEVTVNLDGRVISKSTHKADRRSGFRFRPV